MTNNPSRVCIGCGQVDDHPRHVIVTGGEEVPWHYDCHATITGCDICVKVIKDANGKTGEALRKYLMSKKG